MDNKIYHIPRWVGNKEKFQELYKEFKRSLLNGNALKFLKEKIFEPNNAISIIVPNSINKVNIIRESILICKYHKAYKKIYKCL